MTNRTAAAQLATPAQTAFILKLRTEYADAAIANAQADGRDADAAELTEARVALLDEAEIAKLTKVTASKQIDYMKEALRQMPKPARPAKPVAAELEDGMYLLRGVVYKVQHAVHGSGKQYAKVLRTHGTDGVKLEHGKFEYTPGAIGRLTVNDMMDLEAAKRFGQLYGMCCRCGATLTDETSIEQGIGPICAGRF